MQKPDARGYFGEFGGRFVPEVLVAALQRARERDEEAFADPAFWDEYHGVLARLRRPPVADLSKPSAWRRPERGDARLQARRPQPHRRAQDQQHGRTGDCSRSAWERRRFIAETGAGQHGVATATIGAKLGIPVEVFMGALDVERQSLNVYVMKLLGARVHPVYERHPNAQGRDKRSVSRLGRPHRRYVLYASAASSARTRILTWCASFKRSSASKRAPRCSNATAACRATSSRASAAAATRWGSSPPSSTTPPCGCGASKRPATGSCTRDTAASLGAGSDRRAARLALLSCCRRRRSSSRHAFDQRRAWTIRASVRSTPFSRRAVAPSTSRPTDDEALAAFHRCAEREGIVPALE